MNKPKIKIVDNSELRDIIVNSSEILNQINLAKWSLSCVKHVIHLLEKEFPNDERINNGFKTNELWQMGKATVHQVRQAGFKIHEVARECKRDSAKAIARAVGQAVGVGHMREHAMVSTDYIIRAIGISSSDNLNEIRKEREWQIYELERYIKIQKNTIVNDS